MSPSKNRLLEEIRVNGMSDECEDQLRALLDERDRYRALLIVAASVLSEDGDTTEADAHALYRRIHAALEGKTND